MSSLVCFFPWSCCFQSSRQSCKSSFFSTMSAWRFNAISVSLDQSEWAFYLPICRNGQQIVPPNLSFTGFPLHGQCALGCRGHAKTQPLCGFLKSWAASFKYSSLYSHQRTIQVSCWLELVDRNAVKRHLSARVSICDVFVIISQWTSQMTICWFYFAYSLIFSNFNRNHLSKSQLCLAKSCSCVLLYVCYE